MRLRGFDYRQNGAYFVTICAHNRVPLFGEIIDGEMRLNEAGQIVQATWDNLPKHYPNIELDAWVIMPNHVHGIIVLVDPHNVGAGLKPAPTPAGQKRHPLSEIVRGFKTFSARGINRERGAPGVSVWQRNYYEHIIRNEASLHDIRNYIIHNPAKWPDDPEPPPQLLNTPPTRGQNLPTPVSPAPGS